MGTRGYRYIFTIVLLVLFLNIFIPLTSSANIQNLGEIKLNDPILLKQNCVNVTYVNITSISVNGLKTIELTSSPISMNKISEGYQTYLFTNSSFLGQYIVTGICDENGIVKAWSYNYLVTPAGITISLVQILTYLFFLFLCLVLTFFSVRLIKNNKMSKDTISNSDLYQMKKTNEFSYYMAILKKKLWILGLFGVYLSILVFMGLLQQLIYNLGLSDLNNFLQWINVMIFYGLFPFTIFWLAWLLISFYKTTTAVMQYQFGAIGRGGK